MRIGRSAEASPESTTRMCGRVWRPMRHGPPALCAIQLRQPRCAVGLRCHGAFCSLTRLNLRPPLSVPVSVGVQVRTLTEYVRKRDKRVIEYQRAKEAERQEKEAAEAARRRA